VGTLVQRICTLLNQFLRCELHITINDGRMKTRTLEAALSRAELISRYPTCSGHISINFINKCKESTSTSQMRSYVHASLLIVNWQA